MRSIGLHALIEVTVSSAEDREILLQLDTIQALIARCAKRAGAICLEASGHHFGKGQGVTAFQMLAESHISVHTWPERNYAAFDIFMCGDAQSNLSGAVQELKEAFSSAEFSVQYISRHPGESA